MNKVFSLVSFVVVVLAAFVGCASASGARGMSPDAAIGYAAQHGRCPRRGLTNDVYDMCRNWMKHRRLAPNPFAKQSELQNGQPSVGRPQQPEVNPVVGTCCPRLRADRTRCSPST